MTLQFTKPLVNFLVCSQYCFSVWSMHSDRSTWKMLYFLPFFVWVLLFGIIQHNSAVSYSNKTDNTKRKKTLCKHWIKKNTSTMCLMTTRCFVFIISNNENQKHFSLRVSKFHGKWVAITEQHIQHLFEITSKWPKYNTKCYLKKEFKITPTRFNNNTLLFSNAVNFGGLKSDTAQYEKASTFP